MRMMNWTMAFVTGSVALITGCCQTCGHHSPAQMASNLINRESITPITHQFYPAKQATQVAMYTNESSPTAAYRVIGIAKVSKRNLLGVERNNDTVHSMMKNLAASIGGDGLIDVDGSGDEVKAKVIAYQKILI